MGVVFIYKKNNSNRKCIWKKCLQINRFFFAVWQIAQCPQKRFLIKKKSNEMKTDKIVNIYSLNKK